ncbi:hypothetical protein ACJZ2D_014359 [Fusarium nematophilum]
MNNDNASLQPPSSLRKRPSEEAVDGSRMPKSPRLAAKDDDTLPISKEAEEISKQSPPIEVDDEYLNRNDSPIEWKRREPKKDKKKANVRAALETPSLPDIQLPAPEKAALAPSERAVCESLVACTELPSTFDVEPLKHKRDVAAAVQGSRVSRLAVKAEEYKEWIHLLLVHYFMFLRHLIMSGTEYHNAAETPKDPMIEGWMHDCESGSSRISEAEAKLKIKTLQAKKGRVVWEEVQHIFPRMRYSTVQRLWDERIWEEGLDRRKTATLTHDSIWFKERSFQQSR